MKKFLIVFNILLAIAVAYLFYIHFTYVATDEHEKNQNAIIAANAMKIAYFDLDTLQNNYEYFKEMRTYLTGKKDVMDQKLNKIRSDYTAKVNDYNKRGPSLSQTEQSQMQQELGAMNNNYQQQEQALGEDLQSETMEKMVDVRTKIQDFLKTYSKQKGYSYVFATSSDDNVMYYKDTLKNITPDLVKQLNVLYLATKKK